MTGHLVVDPVADAPSSRARRSLRYALAHPGLVLSVLVLLLVLGWVLAPSVFTGQSSTSGTAGQQFQAPSWQHLFGTDELGRDVYARVVHGASLSLRAAAIAIVMALVAGAVLGLLAGYFGGWLDTVVMRLVEMMLSIPSVLLSLVLIGALGFGTVNVGIAVGVTGVAGTTRLMRAQVLRARSATYVEAAIISGTRWWRLLPRYVLPDAIGPVLALAALDFGLAVLAVSSLSFLGYGEPPPSPEWGALISDGRNYLTSAWWLTALPGLTVAAVVLAANRLSRTVENERSLR
jgi:peptide/nickel transport system permease protein